jgi:L-threonylcarbamoyladenylate synthase
MVDALVARVPARAEELMVRHWPGPLTLVLPARRELPEAVVENGAVGVRQSPHPSATAMVVALGRALTATSCNPTGVPPALTPAEVRVYFGDSVVLVEGAPWRGMPSTVVRISDGGELEVIRAGALDPSLL